MSMISSLFFQKCKFLFYNYLLCVMCISLIPFFVNSKYIYSNSNLHFFITSMCLSINSLIHEFVASFSDLSYVVDDSWSCVNPVPLIMTPC